MLFGNYETKSTTGSSSGGYPNQFYGINVYEQNNSYATSNNAYLRFAGRDNQKDFDAVWKESTIIEADNQFHIISAGEINANNKMYLVLDGNIQSITRSSSVEGLDNGQGIIIGSGNLGANAAGEIQEVIFLNDVEIGGETRFDMYKPGTFIPYEIQPKRGRLLMFPPTWTYPHTGLKPISGKKYLLHSLQSYFKSFP